MPGLTSQQKAAVSQFISFTQADKKIAERVLKNYAWNLQQAVDGYFSGNQTPTATPSTPSTPDRSHAALSKLFDKHHDPTDPPDTYTITSTSTYLTALSLSPDSIAVLILSDLVNSPTLGEMARSGYITGWSRHSATTIPLQKTLLTTLSSPNSLNTAESRGNGGLFRRVYKSTFRLACPAGSKSIPLDMACEYWKLLFGPQGVSWNSASTPAGNYPWLDWYLLFLEDRWKKAVNKDLWEQTMVFAEMTRGDPSLAWWSEEGAWPGVVDEFVEFVKVEKGVGRGSGEAMEVE